jgi:hypothetical protein
MRYSRYDREKGRHSFWTATRLLKKAKPNRRAIVTGGLVENLRHAVALHSMHYNFCRVHQTLRVTPAMEAGITDRVWTLNELVALLEPKAAGVAA